MTVRVVVRLVASARSDSRNLVDTGELAQVARAAERLDDSSRNARFPISDFRFPISDFRFPITENRKPMTDGR